MQLLRVKAHEAQGEDAGDDQHAAILQDDVHSLILLDVTGNDHGALEGIEKSVCGGELHPFTSDLWIGGKVT